MTTGVHYGSIAVGEAKQGWPLNLAGSLVARVAYSSRKDCMKISDISSIAPWDLDEWTTGYRTKDKDHGD
jgi:hypothetical protein